MTNCLQTFLGTFLGSFFFKILLVIFSGLAFLFKGGVLVREGRWNFWSVLSRLGRRGVWGTLWKVGGGTVLAATLISGWPVLDWVWGTLGEFGRGVVSAGTLCSEWSGLGWVWGTLGNVGEGVPKLIPGWWVSGPESIGNGV